MDIVECKHCEKPFSADDHRRKFCSLKCCWAWRHAHPQGCGFPMGHESWNAGTAGTGLMKPNRTSFAKGIVPANKTPIGSERVRTDKSGNRRVWVKVTDRGAPYTSYDWKLRAVVVWEAAHGPIPKGGIVHHMNHNTMDDTDTNLMLVDRAGHLMIHRPDFESRRSNAAGQAATKRHRRNRLLKAAGTSPAVV